MINCKHDVWVANSGNGGEPVFKGPRQLMHVKCNRCNARTWVNKHEWDRKNNNKS